jgi:cytochrome d ubiquinol oxidase subunit II
MEVTWFWLLAFMLGTYVVLGGADLGIGVLHLFVARGEDERAQVIETIRPIWKPNEVWLVAAGGTMFFAFPKLLATALSGFYLPIMIVLWLIVFRGLGIELRYQLSDRMWRQFWDVALSVASLLLLVCLGAALGNVVRGLPLDEEGSFFEPLWVGLSVGDETGVLDWYTVLIGVIAVVALAHHGALWLNARAEGPVQGRARRCAGILWLTLIPLLVLADATTFVVSPHLTAHLSARPWGVVFPVTALAALIGTVIYRRRDYAVRAFVASSMALYAMLATAAIGCFPYVLPARVPERGLTAEAAAASASGLATALWWWIPGVLIVSAYYVFMYSRLPRRGTTSISSR